MIVSGDVYEILEYERAVKLGDQKRSVGRSSENTNEEDKKVNRHKTLTRAKTSLRRLINANIGQHGNNSKFVTLTFAENVQDIKTANYEFKKFRQRLEYDLDIKLKYVVVIEFQKRGAIHYHALFFNLPYIENKRLAEIWKNGFVKINKIDDVDNIGAYVTKYMTKEQQDEAKADRLIGQKSYFTSRGLMKPIEIIKKEEIEQIAAALSQHKVFESQFENDYLGNIKYTQFNLKR